MESGEIRHQAVAQATLRGVFLRRFLYCVARQYRNYYNDLASLCIASCINSGGNLPSQTYKKDPNSDTLSYDLHFWLGDDTTLDEAGTAAYKTAELDDVLHGTPVQYREVMGHESTRFRSHFKRFVVLTGGVATGFHHVEQPPIDETPRLYRIHAETAPSAGASPAKTPILVRQVDLKQPNPIESGDVYILDKGSEVWQLNTMGSVGREKFRAAEFSKSLADHPDRKGRCEVQVFGTLYP